MSQTQQHSGPISRGRNGDVWMTSPTSLSSLDLLDHPGGQAERNPRPKSSPMRADIRAFAAGYSEPQGSVAPTSMIRLWPQRGLASERPSAGLSTTPYALRIDADEWWIEARIALSSSSEVAPASSPGARSELIPSLHPRNQRLLETLSAMASQPDNLGSAWWETFREALRKNRFHLRDPLGE